MTTCPSEAVLGPGDENRYPCTYLKGHPPGHSWEYPNQNPPSAADLPIRQMGQVPPGHPDTRHPVGWGEHSRDCDCGECP